MHKSNTQNLKLLKQNTYYSESLNVLRGSISGLSCNASWPLSYFFNTNLSSPCRLSENPGVSIIVRRNFTPASSMSMFCESMATVDSSRSADYKIHVRHLTHLELLQLPWFVDHPMAAEGNIAKYRMRCLLWHTCKPQNSTRKIIFCEMSCETTTICLSWTTLRSVPRIENGDKFEFWQIFW